MHNYYSINDLVVVCLNAIKTTNSLCFCLATKIDNKTFISFQQLPVCIWPLFKFVAVVPTCATKDMVDIAMTKGSNLTLPQLVNVTTVK